MSTRNVRWRPPKKSSRFFKNFFFKPIDLFQKMCYTYIVLKREEQRFGKENPSQTHVGKEHFYGYYQ
nr:MAG TPA: hypothetical protein [Caudoviricetes sp.]